MYQNAIHVTKTALKIMGLLYICRPLPYDVDDTMQRKINCVNAITDSEDISSTCRAIKTAPLRLTCLH